jgi:hypothetical protein
MLPENINAIGTFGHTVTLAIFLVFSSIIYLVLLFHNSSRQVIEQISVKRRVLLFASIIAGTAILLSYTRASFLSLFLVAPFIAIQTRSLHRFIYYGTIIFLIGTSILFTYLTYRSLQEEEIFSKNDANPIRDFEKLFSSRYYETEATNNRLWVFTQVAPIPILNFRFLGYGGDLDRLRAKIYEDSDYELKRILVYRPIKDVYWVTILMFYGIFGLFLFSFILVRIYQSANFIFRHDQEEIFKLYAIALKGIIFVMAFLSFFVVTYEFRPIAYFFWFLCGLIINRKLQLKSELRINSDSNKQSL